MKNAANKVIPAGEIKKVCCYVDDDGDLFTYFTAERLRRATRQERRRSFRHETGAIMTSVSARTLRACAPALLALLKRGK